MKLHRLTHISLQQQIIPQLRILLLLQMRDMPRQQRLPVLHPNLRSESQSLLPFIKLNHALAVLLEVTYF